MEKALDMLFALALLACAWVMGDLSREDDE